MLHPTRVKPAPAGTTERMSAAGCHGAPSLASYTLRRIRTDILSGVLPPGHKLSSAEMVAAYGVGLSPLREALCQLVGSGLVVQESQRGFHVAPVSQADLADVVVSRRWLESHALGLSIAHGGADWRAAVRAALGRFNQVAAQAGDLRPIDPDWQQIHRALHATLISACGSPTLLQFCAHLYDRFDRYRRLTVATQALMASTALDHDDIAGAALAGERDLAVGLLQRHVDEIAEVVVAGFAARYSCSSSASTSAHSAR